MNSPLPIQRSKVRLVEIDEELAGRRLDNFLAGLLKGLPKSRIYRIIRKGEVRINGKRSLPRARLRAGDQVRIPPVTRMPERKSAVGSFHDMEKLILHEDERLLVINKPAGMAVHGGSGVNVGVIESLRHWREEGKRLELVHRLDRGTSGCLMVAKRHSYLRLVQEALRKPGQVRKEYLALVHGNWPEKTTVVDQPLLTTSHAGKGRTTKVSRTGKAAKTRFRLLAQASGISLIQARPLTGRTHQIRVHARWAGHPLLGDDRYGREDMDSRSGYSGRLMLHAVSLSIPSLANHPPVSVTAPLDREFQSWVDMNFPKLALQSGIDIEKSNP